MTKVLAYCAFLARAGISLPETGVGGDPLRELTRGDLRLLWSEVEWPFDHAGLEGSAREFHQVVSHMFSQGAVVPFRLLSAFDHLQALTDFLAAHEADFVADLERLGNLVQMECVLYFSPQAAAGISGQEYLQRKAEVLRGVEAYVRSITQALSGISLGTQTRHSKNGSRIFVLVERGREGHFRSIVQALPLPERVARRLSGPWPPAEFLSDAVKRPQTAGKE
jgi:hypothetical protein